MGKILWIAAAAVVILIFVLLCLRIAERERFAAPSAPEMLFDYFSRPEGVEDGVGYCEYVVTGLSDDEVLLDHYTAGLSDGIERRTSYRVPAELYSRLTKVVSLSGMKKRERRKDCHGITGRSYVCKYRTADGAYVRVTSDRMPPDGESAFAEIGRIFDEYLLDCRRIS